MLYCTVHLDRDPENLPELDPAPSRFTRARRGIRGQTNPEFASGSEILLKKRFIKKIRIRNIS